LVVAIFAKVTSVEIGNGGLKLHLEVLLKAEFGKVYYWGN